MCSWALWALWAVRRGVAARAQEEAQLAQARMQSLEALLGQANVLVEPAPIPGAPAPGAGLDALVKRMEAELVQLQAQAQSPGAGGVGGAAETQQAEDALAEALAQAHASNVSLLKQSTRLEEQLAHLAERARLGRAQLEQEHHTATQAIAGDSIVHALSLTNEALIRELGETRVARQAAQDEADRLRTQLRSSRVIADSMASIEMGLDAQTALDQAANQVEAELLEQLRELQAQISEQDAQLEMLNARYVRLLQQRKALDEQAALQA
jgi:hypothetical protein